MGRPNGPTKVNVGAGTPLLVPASTNLPNEPPQTHPRVVDAQPRCHLSRPLAGRSELASHSPLADSLRTSQGTADLGPALPRNDPCIIPHTSIHQPAEPIAQPVPDHDEVITIIAPAATATESTTPTPAVDGLVAVVTGGRNQSSQQGRPPRRKPTTKILLCGTAGKRERSRKDVRFARQICLKNIKGLDPKNMRVKVHAGEGPLDVGEDFRWFFDPDDLVRGDMLILLVTGHGHLHIGAHEDIVKLDLYTSEGQQIDTRVLNAQISKLPAQCTLEVVLGTCHAEGAISGLQRARIMGPPSSATPSSTPPVGQTYGSPSPSSSSRVSHGVSVTAPCVPQSSPFKFLASLRSLNPFSARGSSNEVVLNSKASVIVWAASEVGSGALTELAVPGQQGRFCAMIGAMFRAWDSLGPDIPRHAICDRVDESLQRQYEAHIEHIERKRTEITKAEHRPHVRMSVLQPQYVPIPTPQIALLLCSGNVSKRVLDGPIFQPVDSHPLSKSLAGAYAGDEVAKAG